jgi:hypothetical protein
MSRIARHLGITALLCGVGVAVGYYSAKALNELGLL